jgi:hypothetical protein
MIRLSDIALGGTFVRDKKKAEECDPNTLRPYDIFDPRP